MAVTTAGQVTGSASPAGFTARARAWLRATGGRLARPGRTSAVTAAGAPIGPAEREDLRDGEIGSRMVLVPVPRRGGRSRVLEELARAGTAPRAGPG